MCTLIIAWRVLDDAPIAVAANRDETLDRPSQPPVVWDGTPRVVAPRDERAGGTWIGYNDAGVFAGISNRWTDRELTAERSRGLLVTDALAHRNADEAAAAVENALASAEYDGFNLLVADADAAVLLEWDGRLRTTELVPGVHVVMNAGYDETFSAVEARADAVERQAESARIVRDALRPEPDERAASWLGRAASVLGDHEYGVCVHGDVSEPRSDGQPDASSGAGFGTRSSSLVALHSDGNASYRYADGPPCVTRFEPVAGDDPVDVEPSEGQS